MATEGVSLFKLREEIYADMEADLVSKIPDMFLGQDGNLRMVMQVFSGSVESVFLANQITNEDMFVLTANDGALIRRGEESGVPRHSGTRSVGALLFSGEGGKVIPLGTEVAYDPGTGEDPFYFNTTASGTIPNPGIATAPTLADLAVAGNLTGTFEYVVTFVTTQGETIRGAESASLAVAASKIRLTAIALGGPGTISRKIYRQKNGDGIYKLVTTIADNVTVTFDDNVADGGLGGNPLTVSTAERVSIAAQSDDPGLRFNVLANTINQLTDAPDGVTGVINPAPFSGGTDEDEIEEFRGRLLQAIRNAGTGSPGDVKTWAESVDGVDVATVYPNDNLGTPTNGHTTVRIAGPAGTVPSADVIANVLSELVTRNLANVTFHVTTFTATVSAVSATLTVAPGYLLVDVTPTAQTAISDYINALGIGETERIAGLTDAVFGQPGILDVVITSPASNQATGATAKRTPGVITIS